MEDKTPNMLKSQIQCTQKLKQCDLPKTSKEGFYLPKHSFILSTYKLHIYNSGQKMIWRTRKRRRKKEGMEVEQILPMHK
jgi:hypothetical protein